MKATKKDISEINQIKLQVMTIYQIYTNGVPTKQVFNTLEAAIELSNKLKCMYKHVSVESFNIPTK